MALIVSGGDGRVAWSDGATLRGFTGGRVPPGSDGRAFVAYQRDVGQPCDPADELPTADDAAFVAYLRAIEARR